MIHICLLKNREPACCKGLEILDPQNFRNFSIRPTGLKNSAHTLRNFFLYTTDELIKGGCRFQSGFKYSLPEVLRLQGYGKEKGLSSQRRES